MIYSTISTLSWRFFLFFFWIIAILKFLDPLLPGRRMPIPGDKHLQEGECENLKDPSDKGVDGSTRVRIFSLIFMENEFFQCRPQRDHHLPWRAVSLRCHSARRSMRDNEGKHSSWLLDVGFLHVWNYLYLCSSRSKASSSKAKLKLFLKNSTFISDERFEVKVSRFWTGNLFSNFYRDIWYISNF